VPKELQLYEQGLEEYPKADVAVGNVMMLLWIALGALGCYFLHPAVAWVFLAVALAAVYIVLRKLVCTNCYYYGKRCSMGWGALSALLFKQGDMSRFDTGVGIKIAPLVYGLLTLIPLVTLAISMAISFSIAKTIVLVLLLAVSACSGTVSRKKSCTRCKMRLICPGSALKE